MEKNEKPIIPPSEGVIDLSQLETSVELGDESSVLQDLKDALSLKNVNDDPLQLKGLEKVEVVEETEDEEEEEEEVTTKKVVTLTSDNPMLTSLKLILGEDITTIIRQGEDGEDVEVPIEELELTPDVLAEIISAKHQMDLEEIKSNSISTKGVSELGKALIEIEKSGGNITELLRVKKAISDPIENLDLDTVSGQKEALKIRLQASNTKEEDIDLLISAYESKGILEEKANSAANELKEYFKDLVKEQQEAIAKANETRDQLLKDYTKELKTSLNSTFELKPPIQDKIIKYSTKKNDDGSYEIDAIYNQWRNDPKKTALLSLFLLDNEEYNNQVSSKKRQADKLDSAGKLSVIRLKKPTVNKDKQNTDRNSPSLIDLSTLT